MRVSVVICTLNRADSLSDTLAALRFQSFRAFEVVVVNGPSTDHTIEVMAGHEGAIRVLSCAEPNLSMSRNIGLRAAAGDVVAFIDDDAIPEFDWLREAIEPFADPSVGGVGGVVFDHTGYELQYRYSAIDRFGQPRWTNETPYDDGARPGSALVPYLQGTNALFRRAALEHIGGFDEVYDYYLDESDVCLRLVDAGFLLRQLPKAAVHHKSLPSSVRDANRVVTNWFPIIKNQTYFAYRHALPVFGAEAVDATAHALLQQRLDDACVDELAGRLPTGSADEAARIGAEAFARGRTLALRLQRSAPVETVSHPEFRPFPTTPHDGDRVLLVAPHGRRANSDQSRRAAAALAAAGHEVRLLLPSDQHSTVDLEDGIWVHRLSTLRGSRQAMMAATGAEVVRLDAVAPVDRVVRLGRRGQIISSDPANMRRRVPAQIDARLHSSGFASKKESLLARLTRLLSRGATIPGVPKARHLAERTIAPYLRADLVQLNDQTLALNHQVRTDLERLQHERNQLREQLEELRQRVDDTALASAGSLRSIQRQLHAAHDDLGARLRDVQQLAQRIDGLQSWTQATIESRVVATQQETLNAVERDDAKRWADRHSAITAWIHESVSRVDAAELRLDERIAMIRSEVMYELRYGVRRPSEDAHVDIINPDKLTEMADRLRVNIGCGHIALDGYVNVDMRALPGVDVVAPADRLPFEPESLDELFSAHVLEHFPSEELTRKLLPYWITLLKPGGKFRAVVPDLASMIKGVAAGEISFEDFRRVTYGDQEYEGDFHFNAFSPDSIGRQLTDAGLTDVQVLDVGRRNGLCLEFEIEARRPPAPS